MTAGTEYRFVGGVMTATKSYTEWCKSALPARVCW